MEAHGGSKIFRFGGAAVLNSCGGKDVLRTAMPHQTAEREFPVGRPTHRLPGRAHAFLAALAAPAKEIGKTVWREKRELSSHGR